MVSGNNGAMQALFRSISDDGMTWLFLVLAHGGWAITCNGERVAAGTGTNVSVDFGVRKFLSLTAESNSFKSRRLAVSS